MVDQPSRRHVDDRVFMLGALITSWFIAPPMMRVRAHDGVSIVIGRVGNAIRGLRLISSRNYLPRWSVLSVNGSGNAGSTLQDDALQVAADGRPSTGTLYGWLVLDTCKLRQARWVVRSTDTIVTYARSFLRESFAVVYAFAKDPLVSGGRDDFSRVIDEAVAGRPLCILKLYVMLPNDHDFTRVKLRWVHQLAEKNYSVFAYPACPRDRVNLGPTLEGFLSRLGKHSRRNFRLVRKRAIEHGLVHQTQSATRHLDGQMQDLLDHSHPVGFGSSTVSAIHRMLAGHGQGFHSILSLPSGDVLSCCSGFVEGSTAFIIHQMNHADYLRRSPSLTNRAFLIESLIQNGVKDLVFVRGCRGVLHHACRPERAATVWVVRRSPISILCAIMLLGQFPLREFPLKLHSFVGRLFGRGPGMDVA